MRVHTKAVPAGADPEDYPPVPFTADEETAQDAIEASWAAGATRRTALAEITRLESQITPRRIREATLTDDGKTWLAAQEALIMLERAKL